MAVNRFGDETEEVLLQLIKQGEYAAFDELYNRYFSILYSSAYNLLRDHQQSKDIVQDIFVWFWEHRLQWTLTSCKGYLLTAVKFKTANYFRENKVKDDFYKALAKQKMEVADQSVEMEVMQLNELIRNITAELPNRCRQAFMMSRFDQLSNKEIATKLNITEKTVEAHITASLKKLKEKLGKGNMLLYFFI